MKRSCDACGTEYEAKRASSQFCGDTCRKRAKRGARAPTGRPAAARATVVEADFAPEGGEAEQFTRKQLDEAGRLDTALGRVALILARRLDAGGDTGAGLASLAKRHAEQLELATAGANQVADPLDELKAARDRKLRGA